MFQIKGHEPHGSRNKFPPLLEFFCATTIAHKKFSYRVELLGHCIKGIQGGLSKRVPGIDHSKSPLKKIIKNLFDAKLEPLSSILTWSSSAICHLVCSQCSMLSVYLKCVSRFFQRIKILNKNLSQFLQCKFNLHLPHSGPPSTSSTEVNIAKVKENKERILFERYEAFERANSSKKGRFVKRKFMDFAPR